MHDFVRRAISRISLSNKHPINGHNIVWRAIRRIAIVVIALYFLRIAIAKEKERKFVKEYMGKIRGKK